jgi:hypothetical protein
MKGLAWFAKQVPSEGFSDLSQGRVAEKEIPHSDQWIFPANEPNTYHPERFNKKHVIKGSNRSPGMSQLVIDEIYQSNEYKNNQAAHNATYENGRYVFAYPAAWQNANSVNKMVAVRRIETKPHKYFLNFKLTVTTDDGAKVHDIAVQIPSNYIIEECCSAIKLVIDKAFKDQAYTILFYYKDKVNISFPAGGGVYFPFLIEQIDDNDDLLRLFNYPLDKKTDVYTTNVSFDFPNVISRDIQDIFLHASFVSNSTSGYLGRGGEFYPKPSKIYPDDGQGYFIIETSLDGHTPIQMPYEDFIIELTFIIDSETYIAQ